MRPSVFIATVGMFLSLSGSAHAAYSSAFKQKMLKAIETKSAQWGQTVQGVEVLKLQVQKGYFYQEPKTGPRHTFGYFVKAKVQVAGQTVPVIVGGYVKDRGMVAPSSTVGVGQDFEFNQLVTKVLAQPRMAIGTKRKSAFLTFMQ